MKTGTHTQVPVPMTNLTNLDRVQNAPISNHCRRDDHGGHASGAVAPGATVPWQCNPASAFFLLAYIHHSL